MLDVTVQKPAYEITRIAATTAAHITMETSAAIAQRRAMQHWATLACEAEGSTKASVKSSVGAPPACRDRPASADAGAS